MKKTALAVITLALVATAPAHAINAKYRAQLERSGCTEMNAGTTCDIHKTKAQNAAVIQKENDTKATEHAEVMAFIEDSILGEKVDDAKAALSGYGFKETDPNLWYKDGHTITLTTKKGVAVEAKYR